MKQVAKSGRVYMAFVMAEHGQELDQARMENYTLWGQLTHAQTEITNLKRKNKILRIGVLLVGWTLGVIGIVRMFC